MNQGTFSRNFKITFSTVLCLSVFDSNVFHKEDIHWVCLEPSLLLLFFFVVIVKVDLEFSVNSLQSIQLADPKERGRLGPLSFRILSFLGFRKKGEIMVGAPTFGVGAPVLALDWQLNSLGFVTKISCNEKDSNFCSLCSKPFAYHRASKAWIK